MLSVSRWSTSWLLGCRALRCAPACFKSFSFSKKSEAASSPSTVDYPDAAYISKNPIVQQLWSARQKAKQRVGRGKDLSVNSTLATAPGKPPSASKVSVSYPFSKDTMLLETYRNPWGQIRLGRVMEDLDALAGNVAFFHADQGQVVEQQPIIVTASVDRICLQQAPPPMNLDQQLSGQVTWTGRSSMEICMKFQAQGSDNPWLESFVTFVTLDRETHKPISIPPILPQSKDEQDAYAAGAQRAARKKERRKQNRAEPLASAASPATTSALTAASVDEVAYNLLLEAGPLLNMPSLADPHSILMQSTRMQNAMIAQPQVQNLHNRIFGGFLMRRAFELAFANAYVFGGSRPIFLEVDEVSFASPVDVGDLLVFNSCVLYTDDGRLGDFYRTSGKSGSIDDDDHREHPLVHVEVEAWVTEPEKVSARLSNQFHFTFAITSGKTVRKVLPGNIDEARRMAIRMEANREQATTCR